MVYMLCVFKCCRDTFVDSFFMYTVATYYTVCVCRCDIPVVIMGETGCGKTRLIRFMCDLAAQGKGKENMLIMKVSVICFNTSLRQLKSLAPYSELYFYVVKTV